MQTFRDLIACWPTIAEFARAIDVGYEAARKMNDRNNIRNEYWDAVIEASGERGIRLTTDDLHRMSLRRRKRTRPSPRAVARAAA